MLPGFTESLEALRATRVNEGVRGVKIEKKMKAKIEKHEGR